MTNENRSAFRYRSKGSIGYIVPPRCNETVLEEAFRIRPEGLTWCFATLGLSELQRRDFDEALRAVEVAARELAQRKVSVVAYSGIPLTTAQGSRYHQELKARIQAQVGSIPAETDSNLVMQALQALGIRRVSVVTPYQRPILENLIRVLEHHDFEVVSAKGRELALAELISELDGDSAYEAALESYREQPGTDGFFLSCPQWPVVANIGRLERATGKPVVTQLQAILWWTLATLGLPDRVSGYGRLLAEMPAPRELERVG